MGEGFKYDMGRMQRDILPALRETRATERIPPSVETSLTPDKAEAFSESLITSSQRLTLLNLVAPLPDGAYRFRDIVGDPKKGTRHVHDFIVMKSDSSVKFFYIDPEHGMGKTKNHRPFSIPRRGDLRPQVNVMYSLELTPEGKIARVAGLRYRASAIPQDRQYLNQPSEQLKIAQSMLANGTLPEILQGQENEITFRLDFRSTGDQYKVFAQAREAGDARAVEKMIETLATGKALPSNDPLEGQLERFRAPMRTHFPPYLQQNKFKPL